MLGPAVLLALLLNHEFSVMEVLWTFSIYLESVAILPQLFMVSKTGEAESITSHYLFALGSYRALYIVNWIYRYYFESKYSIIFDMKLITYNKQSTNHDLKFIKITMFFRFLRYHCHCCWMCTNDPLL